MIKIVLKKKISCNINSAVFKKEKLVLTGISM